MNQTEKNYKYVLEKLKEKPNSGILAFSKAMFERDLTKERIEQIKLMVQEWMLRNGIMRVYANC